MNENEMALEKKKETAVAKPADIRTLLEGDNFKRQVALALPKHLTPERFIRIALTALTRTPKLRECDQASFFKALLDLSALGIEPDGRRAHLIPFNNAKRGCVECQLIVDYKGLVELAMRSGDVANIHADVVRENDAFTYNMGVIEQHKIDFRQERGEVYAAYAIVTFKDGTRKAEVLSREEIESVRKRSRAGNAGPWVTDWNEMAKKTCFRRLSKWITLSPEMRDAVEADDEHVAPQLNLAPPAPIKRAEIAPPANDATPEPPADDLNMGDAAPTTPEPEQDANDNAALEARTALVDKLAAWVKQTGKSVTMKRACGEIGIAADEWQTAPTAALQQLADKLGVK